VNEPAILDGLIVATTAGTVLTIGALAVARHRPHWSGHLRHNLILGVLLTQLATLVVNAVLQPVPFRCAIRSCAFDPSSLTIGSAAGSYYTWSAAGKFADLRPDSAVSVLPAQPATPLTSALVLVWFAGALLIIAGSARRRLASLRLVHASRPVSQPSLSGRLVRLATQLGVRQTVRLSTHPSISVPSVAGFARPTLLVPPGFENLPSEARDIVLVHELAHVQRRDMLASLVAELAVACFWFNPVVRRAVRTMSDLQEIAADSTVLRAGVRPSSYAQFLVDMFRAVRAADGHNMAAGHALIGHCQVEARVRAILDERHEHTLPSRRLRIAMLAAFAGVTATLTVAPAALHAFNTAGSRQGASALARHLVNERALDSIIRPLVINRMTDRYVAGAAVAVVHESRVVYQGGFGHREVFQEVPVEADRTIWRIGSITKVLTGAAVLQLIDRGLLDLDADVNTYLTDFKVAPTFAEPVRVRHLLTHTAGFDQIGLGRHVTREGDVRPLGAFLKENLIRIRPPGEVTTYDTYAITLAGYLVEKVSGLKYEEYLRRHIFVPLGMYRSNITIPPALAADVAVGYGFAGIWEREPWEFMNTDPASTVNSTAADMAQFAIMLLEGGRHKGVQVLSQQSTRGMLSRQFTNHPDQPGYGFTFFEDRSFGVPGYSHGGSMAGYGSFLFLVPEHRLGIFVATNQESGAIAQPLITALVDALVPGHGPPNPIRPRFSGRVDVTKFVGRYANSMYHHTNPSTGWTPRPFELRADSLGRLIFDGQPAFPVGPLAFQRDDGVLLTFREDARGQVTYLFVNQSVFERLR
jgi:CubicO group peptidase (beta-lactamase class C family)